MTIVFTLEQKIIGIILVASIVLTFITLTALLIQLSKLIKKIEPVVDDAKKVSEFAVEKVDSAQNVINGITSSVGVAFGGTNPNNGFFRSAAAVITGISNLADSMKKKEPADKKSSKCKRNKK